MLRIAKYSLGVGDRFAHQARPQLRACMEAAARGVEISPVWNKSNREHLIVGSEPGSVRDSGHRGGARPGLESPLARGCRPHQSGYGRPLSRSQRFLHAGRGRLHRPARRSGVARPFLARHPELVGRIEITGIATPFTTTRESVAQIAGKYLFAVQEAGRIYRHIEAGRAWAISSPRFRWTRPIARRRRPSC